MLILLRGIGETITVGHDIRITVLSIKGTQVRLGIEAPPDVRILREEIFEQLPAKTQVLER